MLRFLPDTSCMVAALCGWHEHHARAVRAIDGRLSRAEMLVVAAPALVETYAVLTRLPPPHRLSPADAGSLLSANFLAEDRQMAFLDAAAYRRLLAGAPGQGLAGGSIYDAVIVACAAAAGVEAVLTFNERQFRSLVPAGIEVVVPA